MIYNNIFNKVKKVGNISLVFSFLTLSLTACGDFLEEYSQDTAYVRSFTDLDELLLGSGYIPTGTPTNIAETEGLYVGQQPYYYPYIHLMGDEVDYNIVATAEANITNGNPAEVFFGYYTWQQLVGISSDGTEQRAEDSDWKRIYKHINICNMVIATIDDMEAKPSEQLEKQRVKGEAYFLRGAYYFTLANLYGKPYDPQSASTDLAVPIKLTEFIEDELFQRNTVEEVYNQAISDLKEAEQLLEGTNRKSFYRANATAAKLLLSRVYLYMQDWDNAIKYGQAVINAGDNRLENLNTMSAAYFLNPQLPEVIFSMGNGGLRNTLNSGGQAFSVTRDFFSIYNDPADLRTTYFIQMNTDYNYPEFVKGGARSDQSRASLSANFLLRTAEAYLNIAEAAAYKGDSQTALQALNTLRSNRISTSGYHDVSASNSELINFIRDERARELCLEGHRWFDLRRYAVNTVQPYVKTIRHNYTTMSYEYSYVTWSYQWVATQSRFYEFKTDESANTLPIPKEVIDFNIGMRNNERTDRQPVEIVNY